jgi:hypothetical protein
MLGPRFIAGGDYNSKYTLWDSHLTTTKVRESSKVIQEKTIHFYQMENQNTGLLTENKFPDPLDFFVKNGIS